MSGRPAAVPAALAERLASAGRAVAFAAGDPIRRPGDACDRVAFVVDGEIRVMKSGASGREIELYRVRAGEFCVLEVSAAMGATGYPAGAVASSGGHARVLPVSTLRELMAGDREVQAFVFSVLAERLADVMTLVAEVAFRRMDERLKAFLEREATGTPPTVHLTHEAIAERLGTAREVVSRLLAHLAEGGEVRVGRGEIVLTDPLGDRGH